MVEVVHGLLDSAMTYKTDRQPSPDLGELGELYAEFRYGLKRHRAHAPGSDGKIGNDFVELKTISPEKSGGRVLAKRAGNSNKPPRRKDRRAFRVPVAADL